MSVIVMGMEMPTSCMLCPVCVEEVDPANGEMCMITGMLMPPCTRERLDNCPLIPLPEKHGRLGDLDELKTSFADSINECKKWIKELEENGDNETLVLANQAFCTFVEAALRLKSIPTIVEAEGD